MNDKDEKELALNQFDQGRRSFLRKLSLGGAIYMVPTIASFYMQGSVGVAEAIVANQPEAIPALSGTNLAVLAGGAATAIFLKGGERSEQENDGKNHAQKK